MHTNTEVSAPAAGASLSVTRINSLSTATPLLTLACGGGTVAAFAPTYSAQLRGYTNR